MPIVLGELEPPAVTASVSVIRTRVLMALVAEPVDASAVALAVTEAVTNAVVHAYRFDDTPGHVRVAISEEITVSDDGTGLCPRPDSRAPVSASR